MASDQVLHCLLTEVSFKISGVQWLIGRDRRAAGSSLTGVTALCPRARHINPSLVLAQPRKNRPFITERLLMGRKNQIKILRFE